MQTYVAFAMTRFLMATLFMPFQPPAAAPVSQNPWYGGEARPREVSDRPLVFDKTFSIALPSNWQIGPSHTYTILSAVEKRRTLAGAITLQQTRLNVEVREDPDFLDAFKKVQLEEVQAIESTGTGFTAEVVKGRYGHLIIIQYRRPGVYGEENHVVQYLMPVGRTLYRLICVAPAAEIDKKYRKIFAWVAASFTPLPSTPAL